MYPHAAPPHTSWLWQVIIIIRKIKIFVTSKHTFGYLYVPSQQWYEKHPGWGRNFTLVFILHTAVDILCRQITEFDLSHLWQVCKLKPIRDCFSSLQDAYINRETVYCQFLANWHAHRHSTAVPRRFVLPWSLWSASSDYKHWLPSMKCARKMKVAA